MTFVGHCMTGVAIGLVLAPRGVTRRKLAAVLAACAVAANLPDAKIPHWGHDDYLFSHSIFVNGAMIVVLAAAVAAFSRLSKFKMCWAVFAALSFAWLSHLLLDTFYNHGYGLRMFWPVSLKPLTLPIPCFHVIDVRAGFFAPYNLYEFAIEFACYSLPVAAAVFVRRQFGRAFNSCGS